MARMPSCNVPMAEGYGVGDGFAPRFSLASHLEAVQICSNEGLVQMVKAFHALKRSESHEVWLRIDDFVQLFDTIYECRLAAGPCRAVTTAL